MAITIICGLVMLVILSIILIRLFYVKKKYNGLNPTDAWLISEFRRCNVIVFGKKGTGKDLLFSHVIYLRGEPHYANIPYNGETEVISVTDVALGTNTFIDCINGTIKKIEPCFNLGSDIYISDGGIYLPCQYNKELNDVYPSMPLYYALSRQLYENNIHVNVQNLGRLWDKLREQADSFIRVIGTVEYKEYLQVSFIYYDTYSSAVAGLLPSRDKQYKATNGVIRALKIKVYKHELQYDTHYFRDVFLNIKKSPLEEVLKHVRR